MPSRLSRAHVVLGAVGLLFAVLMVVLVVAPFTRPEVPEYPPGGSPSPAGEVLHGPVEYTIDARSQTEWQFFRFAAGGVVVQPDPVGWDLAVRRHRFIVNGGEGFEGQAGIAVLTGIPFDSVRDASGDFLVTAARHDSTIPGLQWYDYSFLSHILSPRGEVYVVRTADERYAKFEVLSYYCTGGVPGCFTLRYVYQGDGSRRLAP